MADPGFLEYRLLRVYRPFPDANKLQEQFKDSVQIILIGYTRQGSDVQQMYEQFREEQDLKLAITFDSVIFKRFDVAEVPYVLIIDPNGVVRGITDDLDADNVLDFMRNKNHSFAKVWTPHEQKTWTGNAPTFLIVLWDWIQIFYINLSFLAGTLIIQE